MSRPPAARRRLATRILGVALVRFARAITAVRADWPGTDPLPRQRARFASHGSNGDMPLLRAALPPPIRRMTRPVAAADDRPGNRLRAYAAAEGFRVVLIARRPEHRTEDPMVASFEALDAGWSLILFPEGLRNRGPEPLKPFRSGLCRTARAPPGGRAGRSRAAGALLAGPAPLGLAGSSGLALAGAAAGFCGKLVLAAIMRDKGLGDRSHRIPAQGGFRNQLDSAIFAAPVVSDLARLRLLDRGRGGGFAPPHPRRIFGAQRWGRRWTSGCRSRSRRGSPRWC